MDCLVILEQEHQRLERLFVTFEDGSVDVVPQICQDFQAHLELDWVLYPTVMREVDGAPAGEAPFVEEGREFSRRIGELQGFTTLDLAYVDKARDLVAMAREHLLDEESEFFPKMSSSLSEERRQELGEVIEVFRLEGKAGDQGSSSDGDR